MTVPHALLPALALALSLLAAAPLAAQEADPPLTVMRVLDLTLEQRMLVRCSAAFALVADRQARGEPWARMYQPLGETGREFFVRAGARLMDETRVTREALAGMLRTEAEGLLDQQALAAFMPVCLSLLPPPPLPEPQR